MSGMTAALDEANLKEIARCVGEFADEDEKERQRVMDDQDLAMAIKEDAEEQEGQKMELERQDHDLAMAIDTDNNAKSSVLYMRERSARTKARSKQQLMHHLLHEVLCDIEPSPIHGVGVFSKKPSQQGASLFKWNKGRMNRTIDLDEDDMKVLREQCKPVYNIIMKSYISQKKDGKTVYPVPEVGPNARDISFFVNCSDAANPPTAKVGTRHDPNGFTEVLALRELAAQEEVVYNYEETKADEADEAGEPVHSHIQRDCYYCFKNDRQDEFVDLKCSCIEMRWMHRHCAKEWYASKLAIQLQRSAPDQHHSSNPLPVDRFKGMWVIVCEKCTNRVCQNLVEEIVTEQKDAGDPYVNAWDSSLISKRFQYSAVPLSLAKAGNDREVGWSKDSESGGPEREGKGAPRRSERRASKKFRYLREVAREFAPGHFQGKVARFWSSPREDRKGRWIKGQIGKYVSAEERNTMIRKLCKHKRNTQDWDCEHCLVRTRGMHEFFICTDKNKSKKVMKQEWNYFSDGDETVQVLYP